MTSRKPTLPHQSGHLFLTDGGLETTLIFLEGFDLPNFAAFDLLKDEKGYNALRDYYVRYLKLARQYGAGFILESPTWRTNPDWMIKTGYPAAALADINQKAIELMAELKKEFEHDLPNILISGCIGPRGDGYQPDLLMSAEAAQAYHAPQIEVFRQAPVDLVTAITMNYAEEAEGIVRAAQAAGLPAVISFTVETNGQLPTGMTLQKAIEQVDRSTATPPAYYMINCAHPTHFLPELEKSMGEPWTQRIRGIRANASCKSHAELDEATELDSGNPQELGSAYRQLKDLLPQLNVWGGCCGTDDRHLAAIAAQLAAVDV